MVGIKVKVVDRGQGLGPFSILTPNCKANAAGSLTTVSWASVTPTQLAKRRMVVHTCDVLLLSSGGLTKTKQILFAQKVTEIGEG